MTPEERARQKIDAMLAASGWAVQAKDTINLSAARGVAICELSFKTGEPDYTLFVDGKAIGTVEAKPEGATLTGVEEQSAKYVAGIPFGIAAWRSPLPFCYESTGGETFFTSRLDPDPCSRRVFSFHRPETLLAWVLQEKPLAQRLREFPPLAAAKLWPAQIEAIGNLEKSFAAGRQRALIQMATGSGKTYTAVNFIYRLVKYGGARRVLFLVDRGNLGRQTLKEFQQFVSPANNYNHENAVADGVNVGCDIYRIKTEITQGGSKVEAGFYVDKRDRQTRKVRREQLDEVLAYTAADLDRDVVATDQIRAVLTAFRDKVFTEMFPGRTDLRNLLKKIQKATDQTTDIISRDQLLYAGPAEKSAQTNAQVATSFREYIEQHKAEMTALQILYSRPYQQRLTEPMLKELEKKLRDNHAAWTEDRHWDAFAAAAPGKVKGRSQAGRFADLVALVRFALEQQPVLAPFADSVSERFSEWLTDKAKAGVVFTPEQLAWLHLIREHIATAISIEPEDLELSPFHQRGGLGKAHQLFGEQLNQLLEELNTTLAA